ncbi:hypothetical protein [Bartonella rattimassiliensis]|nr:hypothetical protein [Bartonella rattimassiliensis]
MSKDQYEIGKINCIEVHYGAAVWMVLFPIGGEGIIFIGGGYGCCL